MGVLAVTLVAVLFLALRALATLSAIVFLVVLLVVAVFPAVGLLCFGRALALRLVL